jgi:hypothetical protein
MRTAETNKKLVFEKPQMISKGEYSLTTSKACTRRMSGNNHCSIRPNTN